MNQEPHTRCTFRKEERINSQLLIDKLFGGGNTAMTVFPLRAILMVEDAEDDSNCPVKVLISVPKKRLHLAIERNRMKRLVREAYRLHKHDLWDMATIKRKRVSLAFVFIGEQLFSQEKITKSVMKLLTRTAEQL